MRRPAAMWAGWWLVFVALDLWADRNGVPGDTFSEVSRATFRTSTPVGRTAFTVTYAAGAWVLHRHIVKQEQ